MQILAPPFKPQDGNIILVRAPQAGRNHARNRGWRNNELRWQIVQLNLRNQEKADLYIGDYIYVNWITEFNDRYWMTSEGEVLCRELRTQPKNPDKPSNGYTNWHVLTDDDEHYVGHPVKAPTPWKDRETRAKIKEDIKNEERYDTFIKEYEESTQLQVQLAGCLTAAEGCISGENKATEGMYGWSPAYQAVLELREAYNKLMMDTKGCEEPTTIIGKRHDRPGGIKVELPPVVPDAPITLNSAGTPEYDAIRKKLDEGMEQILVECSPKNRVQACPVCADDKVDQQLYHSFTQYNTTYGNSPEAISKGLGGQWLCGCNHMNRDVEMCTKCGHLRPTE